MSAVYGNAPTALAVLALVATGALGGCVQLITGLGGPIPSECKNGRIDPAEAPAPLASPYDASSLRNLTTVRGEASSSTVDHILDLVADELLVFSGRPYDEVHGAVLEVDRQNDSWRFWIMGSFVEENETIVHPEDSQVLEGDLRVRPILSSYETFRAWAVPADLQAGYLATVRSIPEWPELNATGSYSYTEWSLEWPSCVRLRFHPEGPTTGGSSWAVVHIESGTVPGDGVCLRALPGGSCREFA